MELSHKGSKTYIENYGFGSLNHLPELGNPLNGSSVTKVAEYRQENGFTNISIDLLPGQLFFVVFKPTKNKIVGLNPVNTDKEVKLLFIGRGKNNPFGNNQIQFRL